jgi:pimeloyl-ACP methyl ester carboxylesterase
MEAPSSHIYFSRRLRLHYVAWGDRDAPPLLHARVASIPGAGHWPHHDRFDLFMAHVRAFLGA